jgi:hypothetical protein
VDPDVLCNLPILCIGSGSAASVHFSGSRLPLLFLQRYHILHVQPHAYTILLYALIRRRMFHHMVTYLSTTCSYRAPSLLPTKSTFDFHLVHFGIHPGFVFFHGLKWTISAMALRNCVGAPRHSSASTARANCVGRYIPTFSLL